MKTDKSVCAIWGIPFDPRVETQGYHESLRDQAQLNPLIHRWDNTPHTHNLLSVSMDYSYLKTDESVRWIGWRSFDPHVETWGYPAHLYNQIQLNPLIHQWDNTPHTHNLSSVSTDYLIPHVKTRGYPELVNDRDQLNPLIHQWDNTPHTHNKSSVSTDYSCLI